MKIKTLPVFSQLAQDEDIPAALRARLPQGMRLSQHQVETYRALTEGEVEVVFNTAMISFSGVCQHA